ncbi:phage head-tail adapter protein [Listeria fleischmannii]|uniref:phage head-tail adapter protein n=1 Tax=Listeria fleischmannii TaxID=1069827 RepID=UPI001627BE3C|nr:phage head-tail adapter protein [Listeria fleischmannii]MBC1420111.1 phage head-tail adapter protein [Listeria fleischmannii]
MKPFKYNPPRVSASNLTVPVTFYEYGSTGPEPDEMPKSILYKCFADVYDSSEKDLKQLKSVDVQGAITLLIRDPHTDYIVKTEHRVELDDFRYKNKRYEIKAATPDLEKQNFVKIIAAVVS